MKGRKLLLLPAMLLATSGLSSCSMLCTVTWLDWDDTVLEKDEHIFPFEFHSYDGKTPTREQDAQFTYEFAGWEPVRASTTFPKRVIKRDTIYKATYTGTIRSYTITFKDASGVTLYSQVLNYGEYPQYTPQDYSTVSHDYEFLGWDKPIKTVTGDEVYTANFKSTLRKYDVTWLDYDGSVLAVTPTAYGSMPYYGPVDPSRPVPAGDEDEYRYDFVGWKNISSSKIGLSPVEGSVTYQAQYDQHIYEYFDMYYYFYYYGSWYSYNNPSEVELEVREHNNLTLPTMIAGLDLTWYLDENFQKPVSVVEDVYDSMQFFGRVEAFHEFAITYDLNGGELEPGATNPETITYYDNPVVLNDPSKEGYDFDGWYDEDDNLTYYLYDVYSDMHLTAKYTAHKWDINFDCTDCDEAIDPLEDVEYDSEFTLPVATKTGYEFLGWKEANAQDYFTSPMKADYDVTLYPEFEVINYPITYQLKADETCDTTGHTTYNVVNINEQLPEAEKTGYTFKGWQLVSPSYQGVIHALGEVQGLLGPVTIKPVWEALPINVDFDFDGGTKEFSVSFMDGNTLLKKESVAYEVNEVGYYVPEDKAGYQFAGWENWPEDPITGDYSLDAKWNPIYQTQTGEDFTSLKIGEQKDLSLHNMNGTYCQFTPLVNQRVRISSSGELDLLMNSSVYNASEGISTDELNYWMEFDVVAGNSYFLRVFGATNTDGITTIKLERADGDELIPDDTITAALDDSLPTIVSEYDAALPALITPVKAGYQFDGWFCGNKRYKEGDPIKETQDFTLVAHWSVPAE